MGIEFVAAEVEPVTDTATPGEALYTCPANTTAQIVYALANNLDTSNSTALTVERTPSGGSLAVYVSAKVIPKGKDDPLSGLWGMILEAGDSLAVFASASGDINVILGIAERT